MYALATNTIMNGGAGADRFIIGSADIHARIGDLSLATSNQTYDATKDILDLSRLFIGKTGQEVNNFLSTHVSEITDAVTGKVSTLVSFNQIDGQSHSGDLTLVGVTLQQATTQVQILTASDTSNQFSYTLLDELKLIAANHG